MTPAERTRLLRLSAGALLLVQDRTDKRVREAARPHIREAAAVMKDDRRQSLRTLLTIGLAMGPSLASALDVGKREARSASIRRLNAELGMAGQGAIQAESLMVLRYAGRAEIDAMESKIAADSLVTQWRGMAQAALALFGRKGTPGAAVAKTEKLFEPRIRRAVTTEIARSFNDEHRSRLEDAVRSGEVEAKAILREWNALADSCERCGPLDGTQVGYNESFPGGAIPGGMHPHCACTEIVVAA